MINTYNTYIYYYIIHITDMQLYECSIEYKKYLYPKSMIARLLLTQESSPFQSITGRTP